MDMMKNRIDGEIWADKIEIGEGVVIEEGVVIRGKDGAAREVKIGDHVTIRRDTRFYAPEVRIGHYTRIQARVTGHGALPLNIGRCCWIGEDVILDSMGGLDIGDGVGIGAGSQLWTHIRFGDVVQGCRFNSTKYMHVGDDAWFVGHCLVSPVQVAPRAMAMLGSVVTRDMEANHVYGGVPAVDLTGKLGNQFDDLSTLEKALRLQRLITAFEWKHPQHQDCLVVVGSDAEIDLDETNTTYFNVATRRYTRRNTEAEIAFMRENVPLVKFYPDDEPRFYELQKVLQDEEVVTA